MTGVCLGFYITNSDVKAGMDGMFSKDGLNSILDAAVLKRIDMISPFVGALMDPVSAEANMCPILTIFTNYVEIMSVSCGISKRTRWDEKDFDKMCTNIK